MEGRKVEQKTDEHKIESANRSSSLSNSGEIVLQNRSHFIDLIEVGGMLSVAHLKSMLGSCSSLYSLQLRYGAFAAWCRDEARHANVALQRLPHQRIRQASLLLTRCSQLAPDVYALCLLLLSQGNY